MNKGYKSRFANIEGNFITITKDSEKSIPNELLSLLNKWKDYAKIHKEEYYKSGFPCPVKNASEQFRYNGVNYRIYPSYFDITSEYFENLMLSHIEDDLVEIGAEAVFCTAMPD